MKIKKYIIEVCTQKSFSHYYYDNTPLLVYFSLFSLSLTLTHTYSFSSFCFCILVKYLCFQTVKHLSLHIYMHTATFQPYEMLHFLTYRVLPHINDMIHDVIYKNNII